MGGEADAGKAKEMRQEGQRTSVRVRAGGGEARNAHGKGKKKQIPLTVTKSLPGISQLILFKSHGPGLYNLATPG